MAALLVENDGAGAALVARDVDAAWMGRARGCGVELKKGGPLISACVPGWRSTEIAAGWCSAGKANLGLIPALMWRF